MYMNADIEVKKENAYTLPEEAIVSFEGKNYVFVNKKNKEYIFTEVQLGAKENGFIEIIQPEFLMDKSVVITGAYNLLMKLKNTEEE